MPVLLLLIFGIIQFAHIWIARQMTAYAAYCATRAVLVVPQGEQESAARNAAKVALSWMCLADSRGQSPVSIPGWGGVLGSGSVDTRVVVDSLLANGSDDEVAAVEVKFRFPLMISGMAVNKIIAKASRGRLGLPDNGKNVDFYEDLHTAATGYGGDIDGWPYIELTETCVLPMPYSTKNFPSGAFDDVDIRGGGS